MKTSEQLAHDIFQKIRLREERKHSGRKRVRRFAVCLALFVALPLSVFFTAQSFGGAFFERAWEQTEPTTSSESGE